MAFGTGTINSLGGAVQDLFAADAHRAKATGLRIEAGNYERSSEYAEKNARFTETSTEIKQAQLDRDIFKTLGGIDADVAGAGFAMSGSALDIMRDSAAQGALTKAVGGLQGLITEEGYTVQAKNYADMGKAAMLAAEAEEDAATGAQWSMAFKAASAVTSIFLK
jgi:hypothetical protein